MVEIRNAYKILIKKPDGKRQHRRPRCRWEDNIRMYLREREGKRFELDASNSG
jgi:hypothetical protein